jgi:uncharacterized membrane protein YidH (DUF202 family)
MTAEAPKRRLEEAAEESVLIGGIQLILAEKRTSLSVMRTGIAVLALPLGVFSLLVATSRYWSASEVVHLLLGVLVLCLGLVLLGTYLMIHSFLRIRRFEAEIRQLRREHPVLAQFLD